MSPGVRVLLCILAVAGIRPLAAAETRSELEFFRDSWTIKGLETSYTETCEWLPGGGFLACRAEDRSEGEPSYSLSIFGYSESHGQYTYDGFGGAGLHRSLRGNVHGGVWRFHGQSDRGPNWRRWQVTITPSAQGFQFREEASDLSGPWKEVAAFEYIRRGTLP